MSKSFEALQKHAINLELDLQQCKEKIKNDKSFKENQSNVFIKEREQYFEIQDLKAQLQDKGIAISELKKLIEKMKGKSVETKFEKSSVIRQPNAFKSKRQSVLGKPAIFSDSLKKKDFSKSKSVTKNNVSNDFSKPVTAQILPQNIKSILKNTNVIAPGMYKLVEIILFIVDSGCSKHMTRNLKLLTNFVEKFLGTVKFGNDQIASIIGYGDLVQGTITIKRGNDLLTGSRGTNMYSITLQDTYTPNPIFLMVIASSSQAWLWDRPKTVTTSNELDLLFSPMFDELLNGTTQVVPKSSAEFKNTPLYEIKSPRGIFINQAKYAQEILKKYGMTSCDIIGTPMAMKHLDADLSGTPVDQTKYHSMVRAFMYLTASRPDIVHATCYCARYQAKLTEKHLNAVKRIFRYLKDTINMGLWYPKDTDFKLTAFSYSDHVEQVERGIVELFFVETEYQLADLFTKALPEARFKYLVRRLGMRCLTPEELEVLANESA
ncbi:hypothetical protein Tco_0987543 [Tanacetum coccineum]